MGYATADTVKGNRAFGANFVNVSGAANKLSMLKVVGYEDTFADDEEFLGNVIASKLNEFGSSVKNEKGIAIKWSWADWIEDGERYTGWVDANGDFVGDDIDIGLGEGLWIQSDNVKWQIQCAGEVYDQPVPCQLVKGNRFCANPCPAEIKLGDCVITGYEDTFEDDEEFLGTVIASKLNEFGSTVKNEKGIGIKWSWADWIEDGDRYTGWVDANGDFVGDTINLGIGEAVWVQSDSTKWIFNFPTVL